jgi:hypothetical protein
VNRLTRLLTIAGGVLGTALAIACANDTTAPSTPEFGKVTSVTTTSFTRCTPQPYASGSAKIGPGGGSIKAGKHVLKIPAGALTKNILITMTSPSDTLNYVVLSPEGLTFNPEHLPTLAMAYKNCPGATKEALAIVYADTSLTTVLETTEPVATDPLDNTVGAKLKHFSNYVLRSRYAVAY